MENEINPAEGAPEVSVEDRVGNALFGESVQEPTQEPEAAEPEAQEAVEETFEFEYDGRKHVLPKGLEDAVMQRKSFTEKSQTLAEQRKDIERQLAQVKIAQSERAFGESVKEESNKVAMIDAVLAEYKALDWSKMDTGELMRKRLEMDQYKEMREGLTQSIQSKRAQFDQTMSQELERLKAEARETLAKRLNWTDETDKEVRAYARELGYSDAEYDAAVDPRAKQMAWEASQYRKLKASAQPAVQQVKSVRTSTSAPMSQQTKDQLAFHKKLAKAGNDQFARKAAAEAEVARRFGG